MKKKPLVICLMGPTASGKTDLAIRLSQRLPLEIISIDSAMVYRGLDIGTAKPNIKALFLTPHRLINICDPNTPYSAGQFYKDALKEIKTIEIKNRVPLLVGGTMLYFHLLQHGFSDLPMADNTIRKKIQEEAAQCGWPDLYKKLKSIDPKFANRINLNDTQRIQRALEVYKITGQPLSLCQSLKRFNALTYQFINIVVAPKDRKWLHQRIKLRFEEMLENNFLEEVRQLYRRGDLKSDLPSMRMVGYRQAWKYLTGEYDYNTMYNKTIVATRQLAKRQLTWLRNWVDVKWFCSEDKNLISQILRYLQIVCPLL